MDALYKSYCDLEHKCKVRDEAGWWLGVTPENRECFQSGLCELRDRSPREFKFIMEERLSLYYTNAGSRPMSGPESLLREIVSQRPSSAALVVSISPLTRAQRGEREATLLHGLKELILDSYSSFCDLEDDLDDAQRGVEQIKINKQEQGELLLQLIQTYASRAAGKADGLVLSLERSLMGRF